MPFPLPPRPVSEKVRDLGKQVAEVGDSSVRVQACESCHGPNGEGEPFTGVPYLGGQYSHYIRRSDSNVSPRLSEERADARSCS